MKIHILSDLHIEFADYEIQVVGAGLKLSICAGLKLTRRLNDVVYYTGKVS